MSGMDKTVTDSVTGLVWQGNFAAIKNKDINWADALTACKDLDFAGQTDWRLPSRRELASLLDAGRPFPGSPTPAGVAPILPEAFEELIKAAEADGIHYLTDASVAENPKAKVWAFLAKPGVSLLLKADQSDARKSRALCVRGPMNYRTPNFLQNKETVRDATTGLVWQRSVIMTGLTWTQALAYCNSVKLNNEGGFRLPNVKELLYLVDDTVEMPAIDVEAFPSTPVNTFWTSTPFAGEPSRVFAVDFTRGDVITTDPPSPNLVRCVR